MFAVRRQRDRTHVISMMKSVIEERTLPACCDRHLANRACCSRMLRPHARCVRSPFVVVRHLSFLICALFIAGTASVYAQKRSITEKDLFDFVWIGDPQSSPDGMRVAFVRVTVNEKKEGYNTSIWSVPVAGGEEPHQLTKGDHDSAPRWSPDGKYLMFLRAKEKDGKTEQPQLAVLPMAGGDSIVFTDLPKGVGNPVWSPDGKTIAFTSETNAEDLAKQEKKKKKEEELKKAVSATSPSSSPEASKSPAEKNAATKTASDEAAKKAEAESEHE